VSGSCEAMDHSTTWGGAFAAASSYLLSEWGYRERPRLARVTAIEHSETGKGEESMTALKFSVLTYWFLVRGVALFPLVPVTRFQRRFCAPASAQTFGLPPGVFPRWLPPSAGAATAGWKPRSTPLLRFPRSRRFPIQPPTGRIPALAGSLIPQLKCEFAMGFAGGRDVVTRGTTRNRDVFRLCILGATMSG